MVVQKIWMQNAQLKKFREMASTTSYERAWLDSPRMHRVGSSELLLFSSFPSEYIAMEQDVLKKLCWIVLNKYDACVLWLREEDEMTMVDHGCM